MSGFRIVSVLPIPARRQGNNNNNGNASSLPFNGNQQAPAQKFNYDTNGLSDINQPEKDKESSQNKKK